MLWARGREKKRCRDKVPNTMWPLPKRFGSSVSGKGKISKKHEKGPRLKESPTERETEKKEVLK